jgi:hypothetical protein
MTRPEHWLWSHDIEADQVAALGPPGWTLVSLSSYGPHDRRRFAAVLHQGPAVGRIPVLDLHDGAIGQRLAHARVRPVAITAGPGLVPRMSLLVESGSGPGASRVVTGLGADELRALAGEPGGIVGVTTYTVRGVRQYAAVHDSGAGPTLVFPGVTAGELRSELRRARASVTRLRAYAQAGQLLLCAVAERSVSGFSAWYADLEADGVARKLDWHRAYPADLDAVRDERGVRYTVVMRR